MAEKTGRKKSKQLKDDAKLDRIFLIICIAILAISFIFEYIPVIIAIILLLLIVVITVLTALKQKPELKDRIKRLLKWNKRS